jgi:hypothetical protein
MECNAILTEWELEVEAKRIEGAVASLVTGPAKLAPTKDGPIVLNA